MMIFYKNTLSYKAAENSALHALHSKVIIHYSVTIEWTEKDERIRLININVAAGVYGSLAYDNKKNETQKIKCLYKINQRFR